MIKNVNTLGVFSLLKFLVLAFLHGFSWVFTTGLNFWILYDIMLQVGFYTLLRQRIGQSRNKEQM